MSMYDGIDFSKARKNKAEKPPFFTPERKKDFLVASSVAISILLLAYAAWGSFSWRKKHPGRPGKDAPTHPLADGAGLTFDIELAQRTRPGVTGRLRVEARPWN